MVQNYNPISGFTNAKSLMEEVQMVQTLGDGAAGKAAGAASIKNATSGVSAQGRAVAGGVASLAGSLIDTSDPLSRNYQGNLAAKTGLQGVSMGAKFGLPGMIIGGLGGAAYGAIKADELTAEAKKEQGINTAFANYEKNQIKQDPLTMTGKPIKALTQMQGTLAHNMSAKQYNENQKMNALAMSGIPSSLTAKGVVEDWEEGLGKARFGDDYDPKKADIA